MNVLGPTLLLGFTLMCLGWVRKGVACGIAQVPGMETTGQVIIA